MPKLVYVMQQFEQAWGRRADVGSYGAEVMGLVGKSGVRVVVAQMWVSEQVRASQVRASRAGRGAPGVGGAQERGTCGGDFIVI